MTPPPAVLLLLAPLLFQEKPAAAPPELAATVQFSTGADLAGGWQSTVVDLDSRTTRELDLTLRLEDDSALAVATRRERLAPKARKRVFLYSPVPAFARGTAARYRITDDRGTELASGQLRASTRGFVVNAFQIALFCRIPAGEDDFGIPSSFNNAEIRCARLSAETVPDRWVGLAALDLIVLHDAPLDELTTDQARAIQDYVRLGGTVLVLPGATPGTFSHPVVQSIAPVRAEAPRTVTSLPGFAAAFGPFRTPEPFLVQPLLNGAPALEGRAEGGREFVRFETGLGRVFVAGADLRRAPFDTWAGRHAFWNHVLAHTPRWFQEESVAFPIAAGASRREELFQRMGRLINPYPPFGLILGLAVVFLAVVGPLNYMVLSRLRRTLLLVLTVPGISVGFLALVVLLGYVLKGTSAVVHSARLLSTRSGLGVARETQLYSLFSPSARTYDITCEPGTFGPFDRWSNADHQRFRRHGSQTTLTFQTGSGMAIRGLSVGQWQTWDLETRSLRELGRGVRFSVEGGHVKVRNDSPRTIERGVLLQTGPEPLEVPFPAVEPGTSVEAPLAGPAARGVEALGFGPGSLGETLLRPWLDAQVGSVRAPASGGPPQRFLLCVLRDEGTPVAVDARLSGRSRTITLLHVAEAP